jgi:hypothetical protein
MDHQLALESSVITRFQPALSLLMQATYYAEQTESDVWEFAVGIGELQRLGLDPTDLRLLAKTHIVHHATEITSKSSISRVFQESTNLAFTTRSCFVSTEHGSDVARNMCDPGREPAKSCAAPKWDAEMRELRIGGFPPIAESRCPETQDTQSRSIMQQTTTCAARN